MPQEKIIIKFEPKGDKQLIAAINKLNVATKGLGGAAATTTASTNAMTGAMLLGTRNTRLLSGMFATFRSKVLLATFAMSLFIKPLLKIGAQAAKVESLTRAFKTLQGGTTKASVAMSKLKNATNGTMTEMDLLKQANSAMVLGVTKSSSEMAEMFDIAQRLGRALGQDTASSVESLITGIGRQSRLMLDNIGIIVKSEEAYQAYADKLGISADQLTDADKKQAFFTATMESARAKVKLLGDEVITSEDAFQQFSTATTEFSTAIGEVLLPALISMMKHTTEVTVAWNNFFKSISRGSRELDPLAVFRDSVPKTKKELESLIETLEEQRKTMIGLDQETQKVAKTNNAVLQPGMTKIVGIVKDGTAEFGKFGKIVGDEIPDDMKNMVRILQSGDIQGALLEPLSKTEEASLKASEGLGVFNADVDTLNSKIAILKETLAGLKLPGGGKDKSKLQEWLDKNKEGSDMIMQGWANATSAYGNMVDARMKMELDALKKTDTFRNADADKRKEMEQKVVDSFAKQRTRMAVFERVSALAQATMNMAVAYTKAFAQGGALFGIPMANIVGALGAAQIGLIAATPIPKYQSGGMIGGRRHSRGGTMVEAEQGEFIMNRDAVDTVGLESLNRMNTGGGAGGAVTVNVSGNVMSQDYVEGELAEQIKEAIRRGNDFGIG